MEFAIQIDAHAIAQSAVDEAVRKAFAASKYSGEPGGTGFEEVKAQVKRHITALNLGDVIAESIARQLPVVVNDVVGEMLAAAVKKRAKANNALFEVKV